MKFKAILRVWASSCTRGLRAFQAGNPGQVASCVVRDAPGPTCCAGSHQAGPRDPSGGPHPYGESRERLGMLTSTVSHFVCAGRFVCFVFVWGESAHVHRYGKRCVNPNREEPLRGGRTRERRRRVGILPRRDPSASGLTGVRLLPRAAAQPSLARCLRKTTNETLRRGERPNFVPELPARRRMLCGHRPGAAGSPENLIRGDRLSPGDNNSACSQRPQVLGSSASDLEDGARGLGGSHSCAEAALWARSRDQGPRGPGPSRRRAGWPPPPQPQREPSAWHRPLLSPDLERGCEQLCCWKHSGRIKLQTCPHFPGGPPSSMSGEGTSQAPLCQATVYLL